MLSIMHEQFHDPTDGSGYGPGLGVVVDTGAGVVVTGTVVVGTGVVVVVVVVVVVLVVEVVVDAVVLVLLGVKLVVVDVLLSSPCLGSSTPFRLMEDCERAKKVQKIENDKF